MTWSRGEQLGEREVEARQERGRQRIASLIAQLRDADVAAVFAGTKDFDRFQFGVDDPVFVHSELLVAAQLQPFIALARAVGDDLDGQVRSAANVVPCQNSSARV